MSSSDPREAFAATGKSASCSTSVSPIDDLLGRCHTLWTELEVFRGFLKKQKRDQAIELSHYRGVVRSELNHLTRLLTCERTKNAASRQLKESDEGLETDDGRRDTDDKIPQHSAASSNLPFLEAVWNAAKSTTGLQALQKRYYYGTIVEDHRTVYNGTTRRKRGPHSATGRKGKALVDVVAKDGLEWIKVSLVTNHRMLMEKAKEGWGNGSSSEDEDDTGSEGTLDGQGADDGIPIVRMTQGLVHAAGMIRIRTRHPQIRLVLPKIVEGQHAVVDNIISRLRGLGVSVECSGAPIRLQSLENVLDTILTNPDEGLTETLNIDCTIPVSYTHLTLPTIYSV